ncbi:MAG: hypothetical protein U0166_28200 [Acidobacteriota bacterium]
MTRRTVPAIAVLLAAPLLAHDRPPSPLDQVRFDQKLGGSVALDATVRDETGREVRFGDLLEGRPAVIAFVKYDCATLCPLALEGLAITLKGVGLEPGRDFDVIASSLDPAEGTAEAARARSELVARSGKAGAGLHFVTAGPTEGTRLMESAGFRAAVYDEKTRQFARERRAGRLSRRGDSPLHLRYRGAGARPPLRAHRGRRRADGSITDRALLFCFHYDPANGRYSLAIVNLVRVAGVATVLALLAFLVLARPKRTAGATLEGAP